MGTVRTFVFAALFGVAASAYGQSADLFVTKTGPASANVGDNITFTINVGNVGPDDATSATVTDTLPAGGTFVSESQTGGPTFSCSTPAVGASGGTVTCTIATFTAGASATFQIVVNVSAGAAGTTLINSVNISSGTPDPNPENNTSAAGTTISGGNLADVGVGKSGPAVALPGSNVTFTITVSDFGPNDANTVVLNDTLGAGLAFVSLMQTSGPTFSCPGNTTPCSIATLPNGTTATFNLVATVSNTQGTYTNVASVTSANDPNPENDSASASVSVGSADIGVTKSGPATAVAGGPPFAYTITVTNNGPDVAPAETTFSDTLPAGLSFVSIVASTPPGTSATCSGGSTTSCSILGGFFNGQSATFTLTVQPSASLPNGTIINNTVIATNSFDQNPNNNSSTAMTTITANANLSMAKTGPATALAGNSISYSITAANGGPSDAASVTWTDALPPGTTFVSLVQNSGPAFNCTTGATVTCSAATLVAGASAAFTMTASVSPSMPNGTTVSNTATITSITPDSTPGNNTATASTVVSASADVAVTKTAPSGVLAGGNITYAIGVTNNGPSDASTVNLTDSIPTGTTFVSLTQTTGPTFVCTAPAPGGTGTVSCSIATLLSGSTATFTLVVASSSSLASGTTITNTATVTSATPDSNPANNTKTVTTVVTGAADLSITKTAPASPKFAGLPFDFTISVANAGPSIADTVVVSDALPAGLTFDSATASQGTCSGTTTITCQIGTLAVGGSATITLTVTPTATGTITNTATVSALNPDSTPADNTANASVTVQPASAIPAFSGLGLLLLAAFLGMSGLLILRR